MTDGKQVPKSTPEMPPQSVQLSDIYYVLFRHKWLVVGFFAAGIVAALIVFLSKRPLYMSEAKLLVRYVVEARSVEGAVGTQVRSPDSMGEAIINSEMEILKSLDLCRDVAAAIGPEKI